MAADGALAGRAAIGRVHAHVSGDAAVPGIVTLCALGSQMNHGITHYLWPFYIHS